MRHFTRYLTLAAAIAAALPAHAEVKQSKSGICHPPESRHYKRTKSYRPFDTLQACLNAGGRLPKGITINQEPQKPQDTGYSRAQFGHGWADTDGDCQNSRHEALIAQSTAPVRYKDGRQCQVTAGRWISPFTGAVIHDPRKMDIDHVVPLKWAWSHGANRWTSEKRERFANDPANLLSVEASLNRQKGAKGLDEWLPPANQCQYALRFLRVAKTYQLATPAHYQQIRQKLCS
ncbi:HNH endonuclease family protein [Zobellella iuensis]|uniref:HNH endonuclease n=1 Tax=Zobellella iuensis TaxID=2803811 RepID=A0ABS1QN31_9GAMM|nr:HNH endonuclease family protein [Zobellella iuensis]MBL1376265.1 HNH endonuclease [Zobellella iuensis]